MKFEEYKKERIKILEESPNMVELLFNVVMLQHEIVMQNINVDELLKGR